MKNAGRFSRVNKSFSGFHTKCLIKAIKRFAPQSFLSQKGKPWYIQSDVRQDGYTKAYFILLLCDCLRFGFVFSHYTVRTSTSHYTVSAFALYSYIRLFVQLLSFFAAKKLFGANPLIAQIGAHRILSRKALINPSRKTPRVFHIKVLPSFFKSVYPLLTSKAICPSSNFKSVFFSLSLQFLRDFVDKRFCFLPAYAGVGD